jgi:hypothetical protein
LTGEPCQQVLQNLLSFANETDGKEIPTIIARCDPEGKIHYYLGHEIESYGRLKIPHKDHPLELKIDHGSTMKEYGVGMAMGELLHG